MSSISQSREQRTPSSTMVAVRDLITLGALGIILVCIHEFAQPFIRGFQCDDETIRYPYKDSTVSSNVCYFFGSALNVVSILIIEFSLANQEPVQSQIDRRNQPKFNTRLFTKNIYCRLMIWLFGAITSELLTDIFKFSAGRLRPHFIDVCRPIVRVDATTEMTIDSYCQQSNNRYLYITNYYCSGDQTKQRDARLSFLSGHSSYSAYSAAFSVFYIQTASDGRKLGLIKPSIQVLIISLAFYTGLTRISDYKHHWQDVLAGLSLGTTVAAVMIGCVWPAFNKAYERFFKNCCRTQGDHNGEELNRVSY